MISQSNFEKLSYECIGKIAIHLSIKDLANLQKASKHCWKGLNDQKLAYVFHGKYMADWKMKKSRKDNQELISTITDIFEPNMIKNVYCPYCPRFCFGKPKDYVCPHYQN